MIDDNQRFEVIGVKMFVCIQQFDTIDAANFRNVDVRLVADRKRFHQFRLLAKTNVRNTVLLAIR